MVLEYVLVVWGVEFLFSFTVGTVGMAYTVLVAGLLGSSTRTFEEVEFSFFLGLI